MYKKIITQSLTLGILMLPIISSAAGLVPCDGTTADPCTFAKLIELVNTVVKFIMYDILIPLIALIIMYTGGRLVIMPNKENEWSSATESFKSIGIGIGIILGSYVLIKFVIYQFLNTSGGFTLFLLS